MKYRYRGSTLNKCVQWMPNGLIHLCLIVGLPIWIAINVIIFIVAAVFDVLTEWWDAFFAIYTWDRDKVKNRF